jgi:predicted NAD/FAD-dependent oxidoreductase
MNTCYDVIVVGAGMAGLTAANILQLAGKRVCVLEKSRSFGGRMSTRREGEIQWDHGAQYFTAQSAEFRQQVNNWLQQGLISLWDTPVGAWDGAELTATEPHLRYVGVPVMKSPLQLICEDLLIHFNTPVDAIIKTPNGWQINSAAHIFTAKHLILAIPAPQAAALLPHDSAARALALSLPMQPCWALMLATENKITLPYGGIFINQGPLAWAAVDTTKSLRNQASQTWVIHASAQWSQDHLEKSPAEIAPVLMAEFTRLLIAWQAEGTIADWHPCFAHRWRYARGATMANTHVWPEEGLGLAGDWLCGGKVEGAFLSGLRCAQQLINAGV